MVPTTIRHRRSALPTDQDIEDILSAAAAAVLAGRAARSKHRGRRLLDRQENLAAALADLRASAKAVGRERNRAVYESRLDRLFGERLANAARHLRAESKRLRKMAERQPRL